MHIQMMIAAHPKVAARAHDSLVRCIDLSFDCAQAWVACAEACRACERACRDAAVALGAVH